MDQKERNEKLQSYVRRLSEGESLEAVRKDFVENFQDVDPAEIMKAEQDLMKGGVSYQDVQRLCDVHSALFHGKTKEERVANAEAAVNASLERETAGASSVPVNGKAMKAAAVNRMQILAMTTGHPVNIFTKENDAIGKKIREIRAVLEDPEADLKTAKDKFEEIRPLSIHYAKKGDLLYPLLKSRYDVSGPSDVMWGVDDEIRDEIRALSKAGRDNLTEEDWRERAAKVLTRAEEMIYKEQNILLPICVQKFSDTEWQQMARDIQDYEPCLTARIPLWREANDAPLWAESPENKSSENKPSENKSSENQTMAGTDERSDSEAKSGEAAITPAEPAASKADANGEIVLPTGHFTKEQLRWVLNTIPMEISFVDDKDINRYFNEGAKYFKRPLQALDREVYYCHPKKVEEMVRMMISQFRNGTRKSFEVWMEKMGHTFFVRYLAVYNDQGKFVGTMECVENMDAARQHFSSQTGDPAQKPEW